MGSSQRDRKKTEVEKEESCGHEPRETQTCVLMDILAQDQ